MQDIKNAKNHNWCYRLWHYFNLYEKIWFASLIVLAIALAIVLPEEGVNGVSGLLLTILYFLDVAIGLMCELLTAKQSRWSFLIYVFVEIIEITTMILLQARFASMAVALFFWIPIHIASFVVWNNHKDKKDNTKTIVRSLKPWQSALIVLFGVLWTVGIGYLVAAYGPDSEFFVSDNMAKVSAYMDACLSVLSIIDGLLLLFRFKEGWLIWYVYIAIETAYNIIFGQWVLLVYKLGYLTNTTYGLILWNKYIKDRQKAENVLTKENINDLSEAKIKTLLNKMLLIVKQYEQSKNKAEFATQIENFKFAYYNDLNDENKIAFKQYCEQYAQHENVELATACNVILKF